MSRCRRSLWSIYRKTKRIFAEQKVLSRNVKNRTSWAQTWQPVPPTSNLQLRLFNQLQTRLNIHTVSSWLWTARPGVPPTPRGRHHVTFGSAQNIVCQHVVEPVSSGRGAEKQAHVCERNNQKFLKIFLKNKITVGKNTKYWRTVCLKSDEKCVCFFAPVT